jgi:hypothetical protein
MLSGAILLCGLKRIPPIMGLLHKSCYLLLQPIEHAYGSFGARISTSNQSRSSALCRTKRVQEGWIVQDLYASRASSSPRRCRQPGETEGGLVISICHARRRTGSRKDVYDVSSSSWKGRELRPSLGEEGCTCDDQISSKKKWPAAFGRCVGSCWLISHKTEGPAHRK